jgi:hypothetical protein
MKKLKLIGAVVLVIAASCKEPVKPETGNMMEIDENPSKEKEVTIVQKGDSMRLDESKATLEENPNIAGTDIDVVSGKVSAETEIAKQGEKIAIEETAIPSNKKE